MSEYDEVEQDDIVLSESFLADLPVPLYWRVLVMPIKPKSVSKGGIHIPLAAQDAQKVLNYMGKVVAIGPLAGKNRRLSGAPTDTHLAENFPKIGEYIVYGRHAGQPMTYKNVRFITINDDEILCKVTNPETLTVHI